MYKQLFILLSALAFFVACSSEQGQKEIKIATNAWVGYAPLFYAKETGALAELNIKLIPNVSLAEASEIFEVGKADLVTTTQHEYFSLKHSVEDVIPLILIDRSNGGDMILSNKTLQELNASKTIYAYLETDSINNELLQYFLATHHLLNKNIVFINKDQLQISDLVPNNKAMIIVTYSPYNAKLETKGFKELSSTKDLNTLIVIDAICGRDKTLKTERRRIEQLKKVLDRSIEEIEKNPEAVYPYIAKYLNNISYEEFLASLKLIKWINKNHSPQLSKKLDEMGYDEGMLLQ